MTRLVDSRASGLVLAPRPDAQPLTDPALAVAEANGFPVLGARFDLECAGLARVAGRAVGLVS
jgi:hypothetical protein